MPSALDSPTDSWRNHSFWSKVWIWAWLTLLMVIPGASDVIWMGGGSSSQKRVFSPGFIVLCVFVGVVEVVALNHFYGARMR